METSPSHDSIRPDSAAYVSVADAESSVRKPPIEPLLWVECSHDALRNYAFRTKAAINDYNAVHRGNNRWKNER